MVSPRSSRAGGSKPTDTPQPSIRNIQLDSIGHHPPSDSPLRNRVPEPVPPFLSSGRPSAEPSPENPSPDSTEPSSTSTTSAEPSPPDSPQYPHYFLRRFPPYFFRVPPRRISRPSTPDVPLYPWVQAMYQPPAPEGQPQPLFPWARALTGSMYLHPPSPPPQLPPPPSPPPQLPPPHSPPQQTDHERFLTNVIINLVIIDIFALVFGVGCYFGGRT
ncbi:vegetative cell wall protein gp1-like [Vicia villosa]|uniref:vegetative cell wall protein gp1-like n=1 Tax=Vicia villosa TaxID=3911 RepID=UPI00273A7B0C|nr:vegetative cell wall protein gp1-like [Vicia villosa]